MQPEARHRRPLTRTIDAERLVLAWANASFLRHSFFDHILRHSIVYQLQATFCVCVQIQNHLCGLRQTLANSRVIHDSLLPTRAQIVFYFQCIMSHFHFQQLLENQRKRAPRTNHSAIQDRNSVLWKSRMQQPEGNKGLNDF